MGVLEQASVCWFTGGDIIVCLHCAVWGPLVHVLSQAELYETDFRPVPLEEYIKVGPCIMRPDFKPVRTLPMKADRGGQDQDYLVELCDEVSDVDGRGERGCSAALALATWAATGSTVLPWCSSCFWFGLLGSFP